MISYFLVTLPQILHLTSVLCLPLFYLEPENLPVQLDPLVPVSNVVGTAAICQDTWLKALFFSFPPFLRVSYSQARL